MDDGVRLVIHNVVSIVSTITLLAMALFMFLNRKKSKANTPLSLTMLSASIFTVSHVIGVNMANPVLSKYVFMFNLSMFLIAAFNINAVLVIVDKAKEKKAFIKFIYIASLAFIIFFIFYPNTFLLNSATKMYFPNYYVPGDYNWIRMFFLFIIAVPYMIGNLIYAMKKTNDDTEKKRLKSFAIIIGVGYLIGIMPNLLVYDISIDPIIGMSFALIFSIPFLYASLKYDIFGAKVIAKQAIIYGLSVVIVGGLITILNYSNILIIRLFPSYPVWATAIISSMLAVTIGFVVWRHIRSGDVLKHEFVTTVSHKFRTPLTGIKWATENLLSMELGSKALEQIEYIRNANDKLVELTNLLVTTSGSENEAYKYNFEKDNITEQTEHVLLSLQRQIEAKKTNIVKNLEKNVFVLCDRARLKFVMQTFIENAIHYTNEKGIILIKLYTNDNNVIFSVQDGGIGIDKKELPLIFEKFYRTSEARTMDTEGMGIGLFLAKEIIARHKGKIWVESEGIDKGSTFYFSLPILKVDTLQA